MVVRLRVGGMGQMKILVVDDHPVVREGLCAMLGTQSEFVVVGEAGDGATAVRLAAEFRPDVVLMDLQLPDMDGAEAIRRIRRSDPAVRVLVLTAYDSDERIVDTIQAGARGYLLKGAPREELFTALRVIHQGGSSLESAIASKLLARVGQLQGDAEGLEALTERETEVLQLMAQGASNRDIADRLFITERTVKFHVAAIFQKLGARRRTEALAKAVHRGLVRL